MLSVLPSAELDGATVAALHDLWAAAFSDFTPLDAVHAFGGVHVLLRSSGAVLAHASVVPRSIVADSRTFDAAYVEAVATLPWHQGRGLGTQVMAALDAEIRSRFTLGVLSTGAPGFYERLGWERWRGPSYVLLPDGTRVRTPDEDDGLMVLRFGPSAAVDLGSPIACPDRIGDAW